MSSDPLPQDINAALTLAAELGAALTATTSPAELVAQLSQKLKWLLPIRQAAIAVRDDDGGTYQLWASGKTDQYAIERDPVGWSLCHATGIFIADLGDPAAYPPGCTHVPNASGALRTFPLTAGETVLGLLVLRAPAGPALNAIDRGLVHLIALQVAAALRVVLLVNELDGAADIIMSMVRAVEAKDTYTAGHSDRVTGYALELAEAAALPFAVRGVISHAGPLHDVGKIGIPDAVLRKPGRLDEEEFKIIQQHPTIGDDICRPLASLQRLRKGVRHHHERYDGKGYPDGLSGTAIPLEARVLAIADTFDAMTSSRPYRTGMPVERAIAILRENEGPQWDSTLITIFCALHEKQKAA